MVTNPQSEHPHQILLQETRRLNKRSAALQSASAGYPARFDPTCTSVVNQRAAARCGEGQNSFEVNHKFYLSQLHIQFSKGGLKERNRIIIFDVNPNFFQETI